jgi:hypothetical protein
MTQRQETIVQPPLGIGENIKVDVIRGLPAGGFAEPQALEVDDLVVNNGRVFLAQRIGLDVNSPMGDMAVGTVATAPGLTDTQLTGEVDRKVLSTNSALVNNIYTAVATWGGSADSVTSLDLQEAGLFNSTLSGQGTMFQRVTFASVILANSDLLQVTLETNVGSNTI